MVHLMARARAAVDLVEVQLLYCASPIHGAGQANESLELGSATMTGDGAVHSSHRTLCQQERKQRHRLDLISYNLGGSGYNSGSGSFRDVSVGEF